MSGGLRDFLLLGILILGCLPIALLKIISNLIVIVIGMHTLSKLFVSIIVYICLIFNEVT